MSLPPKGALMKFSILANSNEDGERVSPGGEGLNIKERRLWSSPGTWNLELEQ